MRTEFEFENQERYEHPEDVGVDSRIILKFILGR
jgi:hypothetical protein